MEILLDTTVQIERIFKRKRKAEIEKTITSNNCSSSTYVLGEFKRSIVYCFGSFTDGWKKSMYDQ